MKTIESDPKYDNTLVVFTADHATYQDEDFIKEFMPQYQRQDSFCDRIPLFFYYNGVEPKVIDAQGRNSLDLTPTILDFLNISAPNYFLGSSLFSEKTDQETIDTIFCVPDQNWFTGTNQSIIRSLTESETEVWKNVIFDYIAVSKS